MTFLECFAANRVGARWTRYRGAMRLGSAALVSQPHVRSGAYWLSPLADEESLLLIILDDLRRPNLRVVRVKPDVAKGTSLAQEVPALIQFDLDFLEPLTIGLGKCPLLVQSVFLFDKVLNMIEDRLILDLIFHESLLPRRCDLNGQNFMLRPPETVVNRCSGLDDDSGVDCLK